MRLADPSGVPAWAANIPGAVQPQQAAPQPAPVHAALSYVNPDGSFNAGGAATGSTTDPGSTATDLYGLTRAEQGWTFYNGDVSTPSAPVVTRETQAQRSARHLLEEGNGPDQGSPAKVPGATLSGTSAVDLMKQFASLAVSPNQNERQQWSNTQAQLFAAGFYGATAPKFGTWTENDATALIKAMRSYQQVAGPDGAQQPLTFSEYIDHASGQAAANDQAGKSGAGGGGSGAVNKPLLTDPDVLTKAAQRSADAVLGRQLTPKELNQFIDTFHQEQQQSMDNSLGGNGQVVDKTSSPNASAVQYLLQNNGQEYTQHEIQGYANAFLNMFLPSNDQAPNMETNPYSTQASGF